MADGRVQTMTLQAERDALAQEAFESRRFAAQLAIERQGLADQLATVEARTQAEAARAIDAALQQRDGAVAAREAAIRQRDQAQAAQRDAEAMLARMTNSTAWRATAPLRTLAMLLLGRARGSR